MPCTAQPEAHLALEILLAATALLPSVSPQPASGSVPIPAHTNGILSDIDVLEQRDFYQGSRVCELFSVGILRCRC